MVLSIKNKERFWMFACVIALFLSTYGMIRNGDLAAAHQQLSIGWGFWDFFRCLGDYDVDTRGGY